MPIRFLALVFCVQVETPWSAIGQWFGAQGLVVRRFDGIAARVRHGMMLVQYLSPDDEDSHRWSRSQVRERVRARGGGGGRHHPQASHP